MPKNVYIPDFEMNVSFPDDMSNEEITRAIEQDIYRTKLPVPFSEKMGKAGATEPAFPTKGTGAEKTGEQEPSQAISGALSAMGDDAQEQPGIMGTADIPEGQSTEEEQFIEQAAEALSQESGDRYPGILSDAQKSEAEQGREAARKEAHEEDIRSQLWQLHPLDTDEPEPQQYEQRSVMDNLKVSGEQAYNIGRSMLGGTARLFGERAQEFFPVEDVKNMGSMEPPGSELARWGEAEQHKWGQRMLEHVQEHGTPEELMSDPSQLADPKYWARQLPEHAATTIPPLVAGMATRSFSAAAMVGGGMEASAMYNDLLRDGVPEKEASDRALAYGAGAGALESIGLAPILNKVPGKSKFLRSLVKSNRTASRAGKAAVGESITEFSQESMEPVFELAGKASPGEIYDAVSEKAYKAVDVIPTSALIGGGMGAVMPADTRPDKLPKHAELAAQANDKIIGKIDEAFENPDIMAKLRTEAEQSEGRDVDPSDIETALRTKQEHLRNHSKALREIAQSGNIKSSEQLHRLKARLDEQASQMETPTLGQLDQVRSDLDTMIQDVRPTNFQQEQERFQQRQDVTMDHLGNIARSEDGKKYRPRRGTRALPQERPYTRAEQKLVNEQIGSGRSITRNRVPVHRTQFFKNLPGEQQQALTEMLDRGALQIQRDPQTLEETIQPSSDAAVEAMNYDESSIDNVPMDYMRSRPEHLGRIDKGFFGQLVGSVRELSGRSPQRQKLPPSLRGYFRPVDEQIGTYDIRDIQTLAHEMGHNIDYRATGFPRSLAQRFPNRETSEPQLRQEMQKVSQAMRPREWADSRMLPYLRKNTELMADFASSYILAPDATREMAPNATLEYEKMLADNPAIQDEISFLHSQREYNVQRELQNQITEEAKEKMRINAIQEDQAAAILADLQAGNYEKVIQDLGLRYVRRTRQLAEKSGRQINEIMELVPDHNRRMELVTLIEGGKQNPFTERTIEEIRADLTAEEKRAMRLYRGWMEEGRQIVNQYLEGAGKSDYISFLEDYFIHAYRRELRPQEKEALGKWATKSGQFKKRKIPTIDEAVEMGLDPIARTLDEGLQLWSSINFRIGLNNALLNELPKVTNEDGESIIQKPKDQPGWPTREYYPLRKRYGKEVSNHNGVKKVLLFDGKVAVDPKAAPVIDMLFDRPWLSSPFRAVEGLNAMLRSVQLTVFSLFHHQAEFFSASGALGLPRMITGFWGKKAKDLGGKRPLGLLPHRIGVLKAGQRLRNTPGIPDDYILHGGQLGWLRQETRTWLNDRLEGITEWLGDTIRRRDLKSLYSLYIPMKGITRGYRWTQSILWDNVDRIKLATYYDALYDGLRNAPDLSVREVKEVVTQYTSDNYGGQEWERRGKIPRIRDRGNPDKVDIMMGHPKAMQIFRNLALSIDWTWSQLRMGTWPFRILKNLTPQRHLTKAQRQRANARRRMMTKMGLKHWSRFMFTIGAFTVLGNLAMTGEGPWENEKGHKFDIDWTPLWRKLPWNSGMIGKSWKQRGDMNRRYIGLGKAGRELWRWVQEPLRNAGMKMSPAGRILFEQGTGYSLGSNYPQPWANEDLELWNNLYARGKHIMKQFQPFSLSGNNAFLAFPSKKGMTQYKAVNAYHELFRGIGNVASGGIDGKLSELQRALSKDDERIAREIREACEANQVNWEKVRSAALAKARKKFYDKWWKAVREEQDLEKAQAPMRALLRLGVTPEDMKTSAMERIRWETVPKTRP